MYIVRQFGATSRLITIKEYKCTRPRRHEEAIFCTDAEAEKARQVEDRRKNKGKKERERSMAATDGGWG